MMPPDYGAGKCRTLSPEELEKTFFYPGPTQTKLMPSALTQAHWDEAKEICIECPIYLQCREANWGEDLGVVGGTDQYERHLYRRKLTRHLAHKSEQERAALAAYFHVRCAGGLGDTPELMARRSGYTAALIRALVAEHEALLDAQRQQRAAPVSSEDQAAWSDTPDFPAEHPHRADAWVWYFGGAHIGHYVAETADGAYVRLKIKPARAQTIKWLPASHVDLRIAVIPVIQDWAGRPDGIQEEAQDDQRPGQSAA